MTSHRALAPENSPAGPDSAQPPGAEGWSGALPPGGFERRAFLGLAALVLVLKGMAILHYRADSDEMQHAHVVWGWTTGRLPYRDLFDNHMPLFQALCAPLFRLLGESAYIILELRAAMLPLFGLCLWCVFRLTERLYSRRAAPWAALAAAALPPFFYTSTEFRTDDLWAAFWLLSLVVAVTGRFTARRAFGLGLMLGLTFAVSLKTVLLVAALGTAALVALALAWRRGGRPGGAWIAGRLALILAGAAVAPAAVVLYFASQGALGIMYYCVIRHNVVPGLKRWGHFSLHMWDFPASLVVLPAYGWLIFRQTRDTALAMKRTIVLLTPWFFLCLLLSYWPDVTREDDLPYTPLTPLSLAPLLILAGGMPRAERWRRPLLAYGPAAFCLAELLCVWNLNPLRTDRMKATTRGLRDVLLLTHPGEDVMDAKGDYIFRPRPFYWVVETITRARIRKGLIRDKLPEALEATGTRVCYLYAAHLLPGASLFVVSNYMPFDKEALDVGVAGKELTPAPGGFSFNVAIPGTYALVSEAGATEGRLDGAAYTGPVKLAAGRHIFQRTAGTGRAAIFLDRAAAAGFHPLFDASEAFIAHERKRDPRGAAEE